MDIIDQIYEKMPHMSANDQKIAKVVVEKPQEVVNDTISNLAKKAGVSDASITRFSHNLGLTGFHQLKILLAQHREETKSDLPQDDMQKALRLISTNKEREVEATLKGISTELVKEVLNQLKNARIIQVTAQGDTYPVAQDAVYKFNQIGMLAFTSDDATSLAQTLNLSKKDVLLVISNSGEANTILDEVNLAKQKGMRVIAITNNDASPIALASDYHLNTAVRQTILQSEYYFSRVAAMTMIEALFLLLIADNPDLIKKIRRHEGLITNQKI